MRQVLALKGAQIVTDNEAGVGFLGISASRQPPRFVAQAQCRQVKGGNETQSADKNMLPFDAAGPTDAGNRGQRTAGIEVKNLHAQAKAPRDAGDQTRDATPRCRRARHWRSQE